MLFTRCLTLFRFTPITSRAYSEYICCHEVAVPTMEFRIDDYDVIGFDLDHTICKYNLKMLFGLIYDSLAHYLVEHLNYPKFLLQREDLDHHWAQKGIILDVSRGNFLKLDQNYIITKAYHGTTVMSVEDIVKTYGNRRRWEFTKDLLNATCSKDYLERPFYIFKDFFTTIAVSLCSRIVDHLDRENKGVLDTYSFFPDYVKALHHIYGRHTFKENTGHYYPALKANPELYIEKCSQELKAWLFELHKHKKVFILTSSNCDIAKFLLKCCVGDDWKNYFDSFMTFARKPIFFTDANPFYNVKDDEEVDRICLEDMKPLQIYSQGNRIDLGKFFSSLTGLEDPKVLYFGDSIIEDIYAPSQFGNWNTVTILEEMLEQEEIFKSDVWGSFFHVDSKDGEEKNLSLWANVISQHSRLAIPHLNAIANLSLTEKIACFSPSAPYGGFYPNKP